eukprot:1199193-Lingulodinium_polyedra.AAC.1
MIPVAEQTRGTRARREVAFVLYDFAMILRAFVLQSVRGDSGYDEASRENGQQGLATVSARVAATASGNAPRFAVVLE